MIRIHWTVLVLIILFADLLAFFVAVIFYLIKNRRRIFKEINKRKQAEIEEYARNERTKQNYN